MNKDLLNELKKQYSEEIKKNKNDKKKLYLLKKKFEELKNNEFVKQYFDISREIFLLQDNINNTDINKTIVSTHDEYIENNNYTTESNNIYILCNDIPAHNKYYYFNIDTRQQISIPVCESEKFEKNNTIIRLESYHICDYLKAEHELSFNFIMDCVKENEDIAEQKVLKRVKENGYIISKHNK